VYNKHNREVNIVNIPEEWGNNFYKSGWKPGYDISETTGHGELTHVGTLEKSLMTYFETGDLTQKNIR